MDGGDGQAGGPQKQGRWRPRGKLQIGGIFAGLASATTVLTFLGIHPGSSDTARLDPHTSPDGAVTVPATVSGLPTLPSFSFPVQTQPTLSLSPSSGPAGTTFAVTCHGFPPGVEVDISMQAQNLATVHADAHGSFTATVTVPPDFRGFQGRFVVEALQRNGTNYAEEYFTVT